MTIKNKKYILAATIFSCFFCWILLAQAEGFEPPITCNSLETCITNFITSLQGIIVLLAIVFIVVGGIMYMVSGGNVRMIERAKATITGAVVGLAIAIGAPTLLNEILIILGKTPGSGRTLYDIIEAVLNLLLSLVGLLAVIGITVGGIFYMTSAGDEERIEKGKKIVTYAIIGVVVALLGLAIVKAVGYIVTGKF